MKKIVDCLWNWIVPAGGQSTPLSSRYGVAYPILIDDQMLGLVAVEVLAETEDQLKHVMEQLQWGVSWMELLFRRRSAEEDKTSLVRLKSAVDIMASVLSEKTFESASMSFVTEMATYLDCDRISIGFAHKKKGKSPVHITQFRGGRAHEFDTRSGTGHG